MSKETCLYVQKQYVFMSKRNMSLCLKPVFLSDNIMFMENALSLKYTFVYQKDCFMAQFKSSVESHPNQR